MSYERDGRLVRLLSGKRVALVGPARTLMHRRYGAAIGEYDYVCRVNEVFPFEWEQDYGNRTDILFHSFGGGTIELLNEALRHNQWVAQSIQFLICPCASGNEHENRAMYWAEVNRDPRALGRDSQIPFHHSGDQWSIDINREIGCNPFTGYRAMLLLLQYDIAELLVTGMTFFREGQEHAPTHYPAYMRWGGDTVKGQQINTPHQEDPQREHFLTSVVPAYRHVLRLGQDTADSVGLTSESVAIWEPAPRTLVSIDRDLTSAFRGRRVALVGPAPYLSGAGCGPTIDAYDTIVRVNQYSTDGQEVDYGERTDIVFRAPNAPVEGICILDDCNNYCELCREIGILPNTGMLAVARIMRELPDELFVTGFDFFQGGQSAADRHTESYFHQCEGVAMEDEGPSSQSGRVNQEPQRRWFAEQCKKYPDIITTDPHLSAIAGSSQVKSVSTLRKPVYALYRVFYGEDHMRQVIESVRDEVDEVFVYWTDKAFADVCGWEWDGEWYEFHRDRSKEIAEEAGATVIYDHYGIPDGQWSHLVNDRLLPSTVRPGTVILMEGDMVWGDDLPKAIKQARSLDAPASAREVVHWRTCEYFIEREQPRVGPVFWPIGAGDIETTGKGAWPVSHPPIQWLDAVAHNVGFCMSPKIMLLKHLTALSFSAAINDSMPNADWYRDKWLNWDYETNNENLEIAKGHEGLIPCAMRYHGALPEVLQ